MEARGKAIAAARAIVTARAGPFAWRKTGVPGPARGVDRLERGAAFVRRRPALAPGARPDGAGRTPVGAEAVGRAPAWTGFGDVRRTVLDVLRDPRNRVGVAFVAAIAILLLLVVAVEYFG